MYLPRCRLLVVATFLQLFFFFALLKASKVILYEESGVELSHRYVVVACQQGTAIKPASE